MADPSEREPQRITELLAKAKQGDHAAAEQLGAAVYGELRRLARRLMSRERPNHTLQTTGLLHEAYIRLMGDGPIDWANSSHFFAVASNIMRRILVDYARSKSSIKRGGDYAKVPADENLPELARTNWAAVVDIDTDLDELALIDARQAKVVELRFFAGMSEDEVGRILGISTRTVKRDWQFAQVWLYERLGRGYDSSAGLSPFG